jgi:hypothetical protein
MAFLIKNTFLHLDEIETRPLFRRTSTTPTLSNLSFSADLESEVEQMEQTPVETRLLNPRFSSMSTLCSESHRDCIAAVSRNSLALSCASFAEAESHRDFLGVSRSSLALSCSSFAEEDFEDSDLVEFDVSQTESEVAKPMNAGEMGYTTVMIREIPSRYTQRNVSDEVSAVNANFDFLYMPPARKDGGSKGYAFVNFMDEESAARFIAEFQATHSPSSLAA